MNDHDNDLDLSARRPLSTDESSSLKSLLRSKLRLTNCSCVLQAEEDATDLLNYALDMVEDGENLGKVLEELAFMEMEICDDEVLDNMRECLGDFLMGLAAPKKKNWREEREVMMKRPIAGMGVGTEEETRREDTKQRYSPPPPNDGDDTDEDGRGGKSSTDEMRRKELMAVMNDRSLSKEERAEKMEEVLAKYGSSSATERPNQVPKHAVANDNVVVHRQDSVVSSSSSSNHDQLGGRDDLSTSPVGVMDLSSKAAAAKHAREMASLFGKKGGGVGLKDRMAAFDGSGGSSTRRKQQQEEGEDQEKDASRSDQVLRVESQDALRRQEMMAVMKDKSLGKEEKAKRLEEIRKRYIGDAQSKSKPSARDTPSRQYVREVSSSNSDASHVSGDDEGRSTSTPSPGAIDLSAKSASEKRAREMASLFGGGSRRAAAAIGRRESYEQQLVLDKSENKSSKRSGGVVEASTGNGSCGDEEQPGKETSAPTPPSLDQLRRAELQVVMRDSSLSKEERRKRLEEVKEKYAALAKDGNGAIKAAQLASLCSRSPSVKCVSKVHQVEQSDDAQKEKDQNEGARHVATEEETAVAMEEPPKEGGEPIAAEERKGAVAKTTAERDRASAKADAARGKEQAPPAMSEREAAEAAIARVAAEKERKRAAARAAAARNHAAAKAAAKEAARKERLEEAARRSGGTTAQQQLKAEGAQGTVVGHELDVDRVAKSHSSEKAKRGPGGMATTVDVSGRKSSPRCSTSSVEFPTGKQQRQKTNDEAKMIGCTCREVQKMEHPIETATMAKPTLPEMARNEPDINTGSSNGTAPTMDGSGSSRLNDDQDFQAFIEFLQAT